MDMQTYAIVCGVCRALAGRLDDDALDAVRSFYAAGEWDLADATLLVGLAGRDAGITSAERDQIRAVLGDPDSPELDDVPSVDQIPLHYRFSAAGPAAHAPDPSEADALLAAKAPLFGGHQVQRAWREPMAGAAPNPATWVYVVAIEATADELSAYSGLSSTLSVTLRQNHPVEVIAEGNEPSPYLAAARDAATHVWTANTT